MKVEILLKGKKDPILFIGDKVEILDFELNGTKFKQVRCFKNGFSKSEYINKNLIKTIRERK